MNQLKDVPKIRFNTSFDPNQSCAIANVHIEGTKPDDVVKYLFDKHHIFAVGINHEEFQGIRVTPNLYTTLSELDQFCEQMTSIAHNGLPL
jgi:selenocysteine lyase/cysteine desulfurase